MQLKDFEYNLPKELIAQDPKEKRDESRLLVIDKKTGELTHHIFKDIIDYLDKGDRLRLSLQDSLVTSVWASYASPKL